MTDQTVETVVEDAVPLDPLTDPAPTEKPSRKRTARGQFEPERAPMDIRDPEDAIRELREENARLRKKFDQESSEKAEKLAEERVRAARDEAVAKAQEQLDYRMKEMEERSKARVLKSELKAAATRAGVVDFEDLFTVMQRDLADVKYSDDGDIINANELIASIKDRKPHFFGGVTTASTSTAPKASPPPNKTEKIALTMSREEFERSKRRLDMR